MDSMCVYITLRVYMHYIIVVNFMHKEEVWTLHCFGQFAIAPSELLPALILIPTNYYVYNASAFEKHLQTIVNIYCTKETIYIVETAWCKVIKIYKSYRF